MDDDTPTAKVYASNRMYLPSEPNPMHEALEALRHASHATQQDVWASLRDAIEAEVQANGPCLPRFPALPHQAAKRAGLVYYLRFADRIKIGYTTNLAARLTAIPHDEVLATEPGTMSDERARHRQFAASRITGEWFTMSDELMAHIAAL